MEQIMVHEIPGFKFGQVENIEGGTGCTVILCPEGAVTGVDVRGGSPGTRDTDALDPVCNREFVHSVVLTGGSAFGLDAAGGVMRKLEEERIGRDRKPFQMLKFRSMRLNSASDSAWTRDGDPRRTRFGAFMRRYSIDELPQLFNVLKGDMSLVGPRPEIPKYVDHFKYSVPLYMVRHRVRPGITGWAQVNGLRGDTSIRERVDYDLYYIENWSLLFDLKILLMTPFRGVVNKQETLVGRNGEGTDERK